MMKYIKYLFGFILLCSQVTAMDKEEKAVEGFVPVKVTVETRISGKVDDLEFRSIRKGDAGSVEAIIGVRCIFKEGLTQNSPQNPLAISEMVDNLITRQESVGNPYSGVIFSREGKDVGFVTLGVMSALGFNPGYFFEKHPFVIDTFHKLGALKPKEQALQGPTVAADAFDKVDNCGLAMIAPALPRGPKGLSEDNIRKALCISISVCQTFRDQGMRLPRGENTIPGYVVGLFDLEDPLLEDLKAVGFSFIQDKGEEFYNKPRTLAFFKLT